MKQRYFIKALWFMGALMVGMIFLCLAIVPVMAKQTEGAGEGLMVDVDEESYFNYLPLVAKNYPPLPQTPVLAPIYVMDLGHPYTLTWQSASPDVPNLYYTIQESSDGSFSAPAVYTTSESFYPMTRETFNSYYYRVRAQNSGGESEWSNIEFVRFAQYHDNFKDPRSGWQPRRTSSPDIDEMWALYIDDDLQTMVGDKFDFTIFSSMVPAPELPYRLVLRTRIIHKVNEVSYGIVFGGNKGTFCTVEREEATDPNGCFSHYYRLNVIWAGNYLKFNVARVDRHGLRGEGISEELLGFGNLSGLGRDPAQWHTWEIWVYEDRFALYVNGDFIAWIPAKKYNHAPYYGIFSSTFEYNYAHFKHAYFYVEPIPPVVPPEAYALQPEALPR